jgi:hypothetical protein
MAFMINQINDITRQAQECQQRDAKGGEACDLEILRRRCVRNGTDSLDALEGAGEMLATD